MGGQLPDLFGDKAFIARFNNRPLTETDGENTLSYGDIVLVDTKTGDVDQIVRGLSMPLDTLADSQGVLVADFDGGIYRITTRLQSTKVPEPSTLVMITTALFSFLLTQSCKN